MGKMRVLSPKIKIRERHADDRMAMNQAMMALYKEEKVNPAVGCLPVLLQIPAFRFVQGAVCHHRDAPCALRMDDLPEFDPTSVFNLFGLMPFSVDFATFLQPRAWPIAMGLSMWLQMRLNPTPPDPVQARIFQFMPIIFTFLLATFPAGLRSTGPEQHAFDGAAMVHPSQHSEGELTAAELEVIAPCWQLRFHRRCNNMHVLPPEGLPEICFAGAPCRRCRRSTR